jgi:DNA-binding transcriptional regulator GbsR (MarR family)
MPTGPKGRKRPSDVIDNAVHSMRIAMGEIENPLIRLFQLGMIGELRPASPLTQRGDAMSLRRASPECRGGMAGPRPPRLDFHFFPADISVMTETTDAKVKLPAAVERFILHWGDMGGQWGVNRSVGQIHALLYLSERPRTADEVADILGMARSNVSNSIRELMAWNLVRRVPVMGDRRDHFEAETDIWELVTRIAAGRKEREIDPALKALRACAAAADGDPTIQPVARKRLNEMLDFTETLDVWFTQMLSVPKGKLAALIRLGSKVINLLPLGRAKAKP